MSMFDAKIHQLRAYAKKAGIPDRVMHDLSEPKMRYETKIRARVNEVQENFQLMVVFHCNPYSTGTDPYKGGLRFHPAVSLDVLSALALDMTEKCALAKLRFGGAKAGIRIDPRRYSERVLRVVTEEAAEQLIRNNLLDPDVYVPGPDVGTNSDTMYWIFNKASQSKVHTKISNGLAVATGKPLNHHGCPGREDATSRGLLMLLSRFLALENRDGRTVAIQGFGNVGMNLAKLIHESFPRFQVNAVSDVVGGIHCDEGLDIAAVLAYYAAHQTFKGYEGDRYELPNPEALLHLPVDFLIPAAMENQITEKNARLVQAGAIVEAANEAVTTEAQEILDERGVTYIPGIAANAGGVTASFIEWSRNRGPRVHEVNHAQVLREVHGELGRIMTDVIEQTHAFHRDHGVSLAEAAHVLALKRIAAYLQMKHN